MFIILFLSMFLIVTSKSLSFENKIFMVAIVAAMMVILSFFESYVSIKERKK